MDGASCLIRHAVRMMHLASCAILDLYEAARVILINLGVGLISGGDRCTYKESDQYFSYRRDGKRSGRMAHLIWIESL